jgi:hypothetical protein
MDPNSKGMIDMYKSKILITSSSRTEILAEKLRDLLETNYSVADLLKDTIKCKPTDTTIEMLEGVAEDYDFAVIFIDASDVNVSTGGDLLRDRDNLFFEAGLFIASLGRERCFIVDGTTPPYLPPDLDGIKVLHFKEPDFSKLRDRDVCADAIRSVCTQILNVVERTQKGKNRPLSQATLLAREKLHPDGELEEGHVVVTVTQPLEITYAAARQVRENMNKNIRYAFYFHGDSTRVPRICQLLQMVLLAPILANEREAEFGARLNILRQAKNQTRILEDLKQICELQQLKIYLVASPPALQYVIHNASSDTGAILYLRRRDQFIEWERGELAYKIWGEIQKRLGIYDVSPHALFCGTSEFDVREKAFWGTLRCEMERCFPGIYKNVLALLGC